MAALVAYRNYLVTVAGVSTNSSANRIIHAGLDDFDIMPDYKADDIKKMCTALRKGTGQMPDPANPGALINATPITIGPIVERRLTYACALSKFYSHMSRPINAASLSRARITD